MSIPNWASEHLQPTKPPSLTARRSLCCADLTSASLNLTDLGNGKGRKTSWVFSPKPLLSSSLWHKLCLPFFFQLPLSSPQLFIFFLASNTTHHGHSPPFLICPIVTSPILPASTVLRREKMSSPFSSKLPGAPNSLPSSAQKAVRNFDIAQVSSWLSLHAGLQYVVTANAHHVPFP